MTNRSDMEIITDVLMFIVWGLLAIFQYDDGRYTMAAFFSFLAGIKIAPVITTYIEENSK